MRHKVSSIFLIMMFLAGSSFAQVRIREKISIDPKPPQVVQSGSVTPATLTVTYTNTAPIRTDEPRFLRVFNVFCGIDQEASPATSAVITVPAVAGAMSATAGFSPGGSGVAKLVVSINGEVIRVDSVKFNCFCRIQMPISFLLYSGVNFGLVNNVGDQQIFHGEEAFVAFGSDHPLTFCSQTVWHPNLNTTFTITQGAEFGAFYAANGDSIGTTVTGQQGYLAQIQYRATGEQPAGSSGTVVIQATAVGNVVGTTSLTVFRSTPSVDHFSIDFEPDTVDYGSSVTVYITPEDADSNVVSLDDNTVISLEMDQTQYGRFIDEEGNELTEVPYADARDGLLQFIADGTNPDLDTIKVVNITVLAIVEGEEVTGTGEAIIKAYLTRCAAIQFTPEILAPGDTAKLTFRPLDGEPFPEGQLFDVFLLSDEGILLSLDGSLAKQLKGIADSAFYIAPDSLETDSIVVRMRAQTAPPEIGGPVIVASVAMASNGGGESTVVQAQSACLISGLLLRLPRFEIIEILPIGVSHNIDRTPSMPPVGFEALVQYSGWKGEVNFSWKVHIEWIDPSGVVWEVTLDRTETKGSRLDAWEIDWKDIFVGGNQVSIEASAYFDGKNYRASTINNQFEILGENPSKEDAVAGLTDFQRAVMYQESRYNQFSKGGNASGFPNVHRNFNENREEIGADYGIMQVNFVNFTGFTYKQMLGLVWNWQINKGRGLDLLAGCGETAGLWPQSIKTNVEDFPQPGYEGCPETFATVEQLWKETYRRYNGGNKRSYWIWRPNDLDDPLSDGQWVRAQYSGRKAAASDYADTVWEYTKNKPPNW